MQESESSRVVPGRSCVACRRRKIRCDREQPCSYCIKLRLQCVYPDTKPPVRKEQPSTDLGARLARIEAMLERLQPDLEPDSSFTAPSRNPKQACPGPQANHPVGGSGKLVRAGGDERYVTGSFWADLVESEKQEPECSEQQAIPTMIPSLGDRAPTAIPSNGILGLQGSASETDFGQRDVHKLHPTGDGIFALWQLYLENTDPVLKIIHVPLTQRQLLWASQHLTEIPPAFESLMFAIYFTAIATSRSPGPYHCSIRDDRKTLLGRYRLGFERALARTGFMIRPDVTTLQALTLFLVCGRQVLDKTYVWSMVGLVSRLAMKLGLHRDPESLGLSPFMSEMRRRLWWQIYVLDIRTAEDCDADPLICDHIYNTKFPTNINDIDLDVDRTHAAVAVEHRTEMMFTLMRIEVSYATRSLTFTAAHQSENDETSRISARERNQLLEDLVKRLEDKYLKYCDSQVPICFLAETATRMVIAKMQLTFNHPAFRDSTGMCTIVLKDLVLKSIDIIEGAHTLRTHDKYSSWVWIFEKYVDWDAVAFLLHVLGAGKVSEERLERAWNAVDMFFNEWSGRVTDLERWRRLIKLRTKAAVKRPGPIQNQPPFFTSSSSSSSPRSSRPPRSQPPTTEDNSTPAISVSTSASSIGHGSPSADHDSHGQLGEVDKTAVQVAAPDIDGFLAASTEIATFPPPSLLLPGYTLPSEHPYGSTTDPSDWNDSNINISCPMVATGVGVQVEWSFDSFAFTQETVPSWDMELDENIFSF
ncbi:fungal-specific transcription factor domain-containing protein [Xylariales sp. PMI_506]|nr:fungal-specific transcription factor domain-containing protein [Xylariales sp. PMI_506]